MAHEVIIRTWSYDGAAGQFWRKMRGQSNKIFVQMSYTPLCTLFLVNSPLNSILSYLLGNCYVCPCWSTKRKGHANLMDSSHLKVVLGWWQLAFQMIFAPAFSLNSPIVWDDRKSSSTFLSKCWILPLLNDIPLLYFRLRQVGKGVMILPWFDSFQPLS